MSPAASGAGADATAPDATAADATAAAVGFVRTLRAAGAAVPGDRAASFVTALAALRPERRRDVYWAGRATLCASPDDIDRYDRVFPAYFDGRPASPARSAAGGPTRVVVTATGAALRDDDTDDTDDSDDTDDTGPALVRAAASRTEVLRHRDVAALTSAERAELARLLASMRVPVERRRTRRLHPAATGGRVDPTRTVRAVLRAGGEAALLRRRERGSRPRRVVLLVDVSGSMAPYADALLRFAHAALRSGSAPVEVFTVGTRLTHVTRELARRDPDAALSAVSDALVDWSGGTRLGLLLKEFLDRWGQRGLARGAVVVVLSDGWERGDVDLLGTSMARLHRLAHRVVWANPRKAEHGYEPLAAGMAAALPHVDDFVVGHSLGALETLARVVAGQRRA